MSSPHEIDAYLDDGRAWLAVTIPRGFGDGLHSAAPQTIQIIADGSDANSAGVAVGLREQPAGARTASRAHGAAGCGRHGGR